MTESVPVLVCVHQSLWCTQRWWLPGRMICSCCGTAVPGTSPTPSALPNVLSVAEAVNYLVARYGGAGTTLWGAAMGPGSLSSATSDVGFTPACCWALHDHDSLAAC